MDADVEDELRSETRLGLLTVAAFAMLLLATLAAAANAALRREEVPVLLGAAAGPTLISAVVFGLLCIRARWRTHRVMLKTALFVSLFVAVGQCATAVNETVAERLEQPR